MQVTTRASRPSAADALKTPPLIGGARVEVCIVGAGVAGLIAAYLLAREGRSVMVVDEGPAGGRASATATVQLAGMIEPPYASLELEHGTVAARLAAQSFRGAVDTLEAIVRRERIACDFERLDGYCLGRDPASRVKLEREVEAARRSGLAGVELLAAPPVSGAIEEPCVRYPGQAQFHPHRFVEGLARAIAHAGGRLHFGVALKGLEPGRPAAVVTSFGHRIEAEAIVMRGRGGAARDADPPLRALALRVPRGMLTRALYWDADSPHCCARLRTTGAGGGEHLLVMGDLDHAALEAWARARFPGCGEVLQRLHGEAAGASDLFACVGQAGSASDGVYVSTAGWGSAMTRAAVAAITVKDFVQASWYERDVSRLRM
jgi:glycine/D-amino acid oxidase-like deaminating enzyme